MADSGVSERKVYRVAPDVLAREVRGETVLLNTRNEEYFGLDSVGTSMWQALEETGDLEQIVRRLLPIYAVEERELRKDVGDLLRKLQEAGLVEVAG